jgi:hypothetical protein
MLQHRSSAAALYSCSKPVVSFPPAEAIGPSIRREDIAVDVLFIPECMAPLSSCAYQGSLLQPLAELGSGLSLPEPACQYFFKGYFCLFCYIHHHS